MHYTISQDHTSRQDAVATARLAALGSRGRAAPVASGRLSHDRLLPEDPANSDGLDEDAVSDMQTPPTSDVDSLASPDTQMTRQSQQESENFHEQEEAHQGLPSHRPEFDTTRRELSKSAAAKEALAKLFRQLTKDDHKLKTEHNKTTTMREKIEKLPLTASTSISQFISLGIAEKSTGAKVSRLLPF